jgi:hypothetical protein
VNHKKCAVQTWSSLMRAHSYEHMPPSCQSQLNTWHTYSSRVGMVLGLAHDDTINNPCTCTDAVVGILCTQAFTFIYIGRLVWYVHRYQDAIEPNIQTIEHDTPRPTMWRQPTRTRNLAPRATMSWSLIIDHESGTICKHNHVHDKHKC